MSQNVKRTATLSDMVLANWEIKFNINSIIKKMESRHYLVYFIIILGFSILSCKKEPKIDYYFSNNVQIIKSTPTRLAGTLFIDDLIGVTNIETVGSFILLISPRNEKLFNVFDSSESPKGSFGLKENPYRKRGIETVLFR